MSQAELSRKALALKKENTASSAIATAPLPDNEQLELPGIGYDRFVRYHELKEYGIPFSRQHLATLEEQGKFPRRVHLSERVIAWRLSELCEWMAKRRRE